MIFNKIFTSYFVVLVVLISSTYLLAQNQSVRFNHIGIKDGLSENTVRAILQDSKGFMWFATWDGLSRYDGYEFKVYKHIDGDSTSLRVNKITCLLEDHNKRLWVGTYGGGLSLFNRDTETFTNFINDPKDSSSISVNQIVSIFEDSKNRIWLGTSLTGVSFFDNNNINSNLYKNIKFKNYVNVSSDESGVNGNAVLSFLEDKSGNIWFGLSDGSISKLKKDDSLINHVKFVNYHPKNLLSDNSSRKGYDFIVDDVLHPGLFWLVNEYKGLIWFDSKNEKFLYKYPFHKLENKIPVSQIESILTDRSGVYWFGTAGNGIYSFNPNKENEKNLGYEHFNIVSVAKPLGVDASEIANIFEDASGLIWLGTSNNGLFTYQKRTKEFISYNHNYFSNNSLLSDDALHVFEDKNNKLWIGTDAGINRYDPVAQKYTYFKHNPLNKGSINSNVIYTVIQDSNGTIWVGTDKGLDKYNPLTNSFSHYLHNQNDINSISKGQIINTFIDSKGSLWIGTWGGGLNKLIISPEGKVEKFLHYAMDENDPNSISDNRIMSFAESIDGTLWIGTSDGGLNKLVSDYKVAEDGSILKPKFISYQSEPNDLNSISSNDVRSIYIDKSGTLWIGTFGGGLNKFKPPKNENDSIIFYHYRKSDGLANDVVKGILSDVNGKLWISTSHGLSMFNPSDNSFLNFYVSDGLLLDKFGGVYFKNKKTGRLYFGGVGGLVSFIPANVIINDYKPKIVITSFKTYNVKDDKISEVKGMTEKNVITLSYQDNILSFEFAALNFYNSSKNKYAYKLQGYNENWIQLGNKRDVTFTNLDPGTYKLLVRGSNNEGVWNQTGTALDIIITPPWWKSKWAFITYGIIFIAGIFAADRVMRKRVMKQEHNRAKLREAELIKSQADELETVDRLVKVINRAEDLNQLFNSLLEQTFTVIPQGEKAAVFLLDKKENMFNVAFTEGYNIMELEKVTFTPEELKKRYTQTSEEVEKGIYIIRNSDTLFGDEKLSDFGKAKSMLVMAVEIDNLTEAYVVFDSYSDKNAFDRSTARLLNRFREHAVSAISKAQAFKTLQEKNEEIVRTQAQLIHSEKLASLGELTAGIAHEIKNPLNFVNNFSEVSNDLFSELENELKNNNLEEVSEIVNELKMNLERINLHGRRADSIVKGMLLHSRGSSGEKTLTDINELLDQYVNLAYHGMRAQNKEFNITIEKDYDNTLDKINVVPQDISRVFLNIINNACYAVNDRRKLSNDEFNPVLKVSTKNLKDKVEIRIRDNGNGIPAELMDKIFQPFFTSKPTGEGTGLGLSLSYDIIVKQHAGELKFESEEGKSTEFIIVIPK